MSVENLALWFKKRGRILPWRLPHNTLEEQKKEPDPWAVLVSEMMLQQTRVQTVLFYFSRWIRLFPTPNALAAATEEELLKSWEGLGYYKRAKSLQKAARFLVAKGSWPRTRAELLALPGVGPYTSAALLAFAFRQKSFPIDANVLRVASRWLARRENISHPSTAKYFEELLLPFLPEKEPWVVAEAFIELGATLCRAKNPLCEECPLQKSCQAYKEGSQALFPVKACAPATLALFRTVAVVSCHSSSSTRSLHWLSLKKSSPGLFEGLWHFPYIENQQPEISYETERKKIEELLGLPLSLVSILKKKTHSFTKYRAYLQPLHLHFVGEPTFVKHSFDWAPLEELKKRTFCAGHRHIRDELLRDDLLKNEERRLGQP